MSLTRREAMTAMGGAVAVTALLPKTAAGVNTASKDSLSQSLPQ
jgi:hypothetical protein